MMAIAWLVIFPCVADGNVPTCRFVQAALPFLIASVSPDLTSRIAWANAQWLRKSWKWIGQYSAQIRKLLLVIGAYASAVAVTLWFPPCPMISPSSTSLDGMHSRQPCLAPDCDPSLTRQTNKKISPARRPPCCYPRSKQSTFLTRRRAD